MKEKVIWEHTGLAFPIKLTQQGHNQFAVAYGRQVMPHLTYEDAARELGACIMHAIACDGKLWEK